MGGKKSKVQQEVMRAEVPIRQKPSLPLTSMLSSTDSFSKVTSLPAGAELAAGASKVASARTTAWI